MFHKILFMISVLLWITCQKDKGAGGGDGTTRTVRTLEVLRVTEGILIERIQSSGTVQGIKEIIVTSKTEGTITGVRFELGDYVKKNDTLVLIENAEAAYNLNQARQDLNAARLNLDAVRKLYNSGASSESELANARSAYNNARAGFEVAQEAYNDTRITAPIKGYIATKDNAVTIGNMIISGTPVTRIVDLSRIRIEIPVGELEVRMIDTGANAFIVPFAECPGDSLFQGTITAIAAGANPSTGSFTVVIHADNPCGIALKSGMTATVIIETALTDSSLIIPTSSIIDSTSVFIYGDGVVRRCRIQRGETVGNRTEALKGLKTGMYIVITPPPGLTSNTRVDTAMLGESALWQ